MKRHFLLTGMRPVLPHIAAFMKACDLGIDGLVKPERLVITITVKEDCTKEQLLKHPNAIKQAYEHVGWSKVSIVEYFPEEGSA